MNLKFDADLVIGHEKIQLLQKEGEGGFGEVWKAEWEHVQVAIKKLFIYHPSPMAIKSLQQEISFAARLRHPNVVSMYGVCMYSTIETWIVMEFATGGSLYSLLSNHEQEIPWTERWKWAADAAAAVSILHRNKIVHRDIKSLNFLLVKDVLKITDFGLSTAASISSSMMSTMTSSMQRTVGTTRWLAPESASLKPVFNEKSDIYALGMVLWEISSRMIPFSDIL